jgi:hypothetical protein
MWKKTSDVSKKDSQELRNLKRVKLYADADIEDEVVNFLKEKGVNITSAKIFGYRGRPDSFHASFAFKHKRFFTDKERKTLHE